MIDRLFDIMNSRNPHAKGIKIPLGSWNWTDRVEFLLRAKEFDQFGDERWHNLSSIKEVV